MVTPCFPWFLSFGNRTQNSRVAGARPNHQPIGGSDPNHQGIWSQGRRDSNPRLRRDQCVMFILSKSAADTALQSRSVPNIQRSMWRAPAALVLGCIPLAAGFVSLTSTRPQQLLPVCPSVVSMFRHDNCGSPAHSMIVGISRIHHLVPTDVLRRQKVHTSQADCAPWSKIQPERCWHDVGGDAWFCERCG
jgi:hypothetical protein